MQNVGQVLALQRRGFRKPGSKLGRGEASPTKASAVRVLACGWLSGFGLVFLLFGKRKSISR